MFPLFVVQNTQLNYLQIVAETAKLSTKIFLVSAKLPRNPAHINKSSVQKSYQKSHSECFVILALRGIRLLTPEEVEATEILLMSVAEFPRSPSLRQRVVAAYRGSVKTFLLYPRPQSAFAPGRTRGSEPLDLGFFLLSSCLKTYRSFFVKFSVLLIICGKKRPKLEQFFF